MQKWGLFCCLLVGALSGELAGQALRLSIPQVEAAPGEELLLPITTANFERIVSMQFSILFDTAVIRYLASEPADLTLLAVGDFQAANGELRVSWFDAEGMGQTLSDGSSIVGLRFRVVGQPGDVSLLPIADEPIEIQIFQATDTTDVFQEIGLLQDTGRVTVVGPLGLTVASGGLACAGNNDGFIQLNLAVDTTDYTVNWTGPNGFAATGFQLSNLSPGTYQFILLDNAQQEVFAGQVQLLAPAFALSLTGLNITPTDCNVPNGLVVAVAAGGTAPYQYQLGGLSNTNGQFDGLAAGVYPLLVTDAAGCTLQDTATVVAPLAPVIELPDTLRWCGLEPLTLAPGAVGSYLWSTGDTTPTLLVSTPGNYSLTVTNADDCTATAAVEVILGGAVEAILVSDALDVCPGDTLFLEVTGGDTYRWLNGSATLSATNVATPRAFPTESITYQVEVSTACAADTLAVPVVVYTLSAEAGPDTCIARGDDVQLWARGGLFYAWEVNELYPLSSRNISNPTAAPEDSTTYTVNITDVNGCISTLDVTVLVADDPLSVIKPINLITPNQDGYNDVLEFVGAEKFGQNSLKVYNRWGNLVYQKLNYQLDDERFDGTYRGEPLPAGSYFYVLEFRMAVLKQSLLIVRD